MLAKKTKNMHIIAIVVAAIVAVIMMSFLMNGNGFLASVKIHDEFSTYSQLIENSPVVIVGNVVSENKGIVYDGIKFAITEVAVGEVVRGDVKTKTIRILQTKAEEDPFLVKNSEVILFLSEYIGPITEDAYVINGLQNGQYIVRDGLLHEVNLEHKRSAVLEKTELSQVIFDVKNTEYRGATILQESEEEIREANEKEMELLEQLNNE